MRRRIALLAAIIIFSASAPLARAIESEPNASTGSTIEQPEAPFRRSWPKIHDPSSIVKAGKRYWCFSTGMGVQAMSSADLSQWRIERPVFE